MQKKIKLIYEYIKICSKNQIALYAAQSSFFMMFSLFPIIMIVLSIIQLVIPVSEDTLFSVIMRYVPTAMNDSINGLLDNIFSNSVGTVISISAISVLWSASKVVYSLVIGLNNIHNTIETRNNLIRRFVSILYTLIFILIIIFYFVVLVFGNYIQTFIEKIIPSLTDASLLIVFGRTAITVCILVFFFALIYKALPDKKLKFRSQLPGAVFATAGWLIYSFIYNIYITNFSNYSYIYGSLTAIMLFMLWMYFCMIILLAGAELNIFIAHKKTEKN